MSLAEEWLEKRYPPELIKAGDKLVRAHERLGARMIGLPIEGYYNVDKDNVFRQHVCPFPVDTRLKP